MYSLLAKAHAAALEVRSSIYHWRLRSPITLPVRTISIGNLTAGGTGKSPLTAFLAKKIIAYGLQPLILSRGYGRRATQMVYLAPGEHPASVDEIGDEPYMLKKQEPQISLLVHKDRGTYALKNWPRFKSNIVVLDDAFQYWDLRRDLDIVTIDATKDFQPKLLPAGEARESPLALQRADAFVVTRSQEISDELLAKKVSDLINFLQDSRPRSPVVFPWKNGARAQALPKFYFSEFHAQEVEFYSGLLRKPEELKDRPAILLAGIANPKSFQRSVEELGIKILESHYYPDHHWLRPNDWQKIQTLYARHANLSPLLLTTEKDWVRWQSEKEKFPADLACLKIALSFVDKKFSGIANGSEQEFLAQVLG